MTGDHVPRDTPSRPTIAYVAIHGIGHQRPGETAHAVYGSFAEAAITLGAEFEPGSSHSDVVAATGTLTVGDESAEVLFIDAWWDGDVEPPPTARVLRWMFRITPFIVFTTVGAWILDLQTASRLSSRRDKHFLELVGASSMLLAFLLTPILVVALFVINLLTLTRPHAYPRLDEVVRSIFGDAWLYRSDDLDSHVLPRLTALVEEVRATSDTVVLVGHSQGAEIGRRLALTTPVDACIWVGGALMPLAMSRVLRRSPALPYLLWCYVLISPALMSIVIAQMARITFEFMAIVWKGLDNLRAGVVGDSSAFDDASWEAGKLFPLMFADLPWLVGFGAFIILAALALRAAARLPSDLRTSLSTPVIEVKSLADPVCFGQMNETSIIRFVPLRPALHREHINYFDKPETGAALLEPAVGSELLDEPYEPRLHWAAYVVSAACFAVLLVGGYALGSALLGLVGL